MNSVMLDSAFFVKSDVEKKQQCASDDVIAIILYLLAVANVGRRGCVCALIWVR
jgi:hypothetical protein